MAGWIKMPLGIEVGLGPGDFVLEEDPAPTPQKGDRPPPIFGPCLLWPNGWMDQDTTWYEAQTTLLHGDPDPPTNRDTGNFRPV